MGCSLLVGGFAAFFFSFFSCLVLFFFLSLLLVFKFLAMSVPVCSSVSAVVASCGFESLRRLFAGFVLGIPSGPGSAPSCRIAAAFPAFVGALVGRGLCSWSVGWGVASLVAASWGVSVGSGGVPVGGRQLSLFS